MVKQRIKQRNKLKDKYKLKMFYFEQNEENMTKMEKVKNWHKERKWLEWNNIHFADYPEEVEFQAIMDEM